MASSGLAIEMTVAPLQYLPMASMWAIVFVASYTVYSGFQFGRVNWEALNLKGDL